MTHEHSFGLGIGESSVPPIIMVDYVLLKESNGRTTTWGPNKANNLSERIFGAIGTYHAERNRLRALLDRDGMEAVAEDLRTTPVD